MSNIINADQYIKAGDKVYKVAGGSASGRNIITANSREELPDPSTVAEGTIAFVPSKERIFDLSEIGAFASLTDTPETITVPADNKFIVDLKTAIEERPFKAVVPLKSFSIGEPVYIMSAVCIGLVATMVGGGTQMQFSIFGAVNGMTLQSTVVINALDDMAFVDVTTYAVSSTTPAISG